MSQSFIFTNFTQWLSLLPMLAVYVVGFIMASSRLDYCRVPALMTMAATAALAILTVLQQALTFALIHNQGPVANLSRLVAASGLLFTLLRGAAMITLFLAVFHGRREAFADRLAAASPGTPQP